MDVGQACESGFIPVISAIAPFISMRCYEQVRNDVGYSNTNVKIIGSSSGLSHAPAGSTHQANEDMALMRTVPNIVIFNPGDGYEVKMSLKKAVEHEGPVYIRMPRHKL
jgi:transketolase